MIRAALVVLAACGSPDKPPPPAPPKDAAPIPENVPVAHGDTYTPDRQTIHLDEPKLDLPKQEQLKLLDAGTGDKAPLVYAPAGTAEVTLETTLASRHLDNGTWTQKTEMPPIRDGFAIIADGNHVVLRGLAGSIVGTATAQASQYLDYWKKLIQDRRATVTVDTRGQLGPIVFADDPTNVRSEASRTELAQRLLVTIVPVPAEPVGLGASWKVVTVLRQNQVSVKQTATYTLAARTPDRWTIGIKLSRIGHDQVIDDPSVPKGSTAELVVLLRNIEGTVEIDPTQVMIASGKLAVESRFHLKVTTPGQPVVEHIVEDTGAVAISSRRDR